MPRKPLDGVERHTCPRGKRPPVSLCHTASAGVGAEGAAPPTRDWFLGMPPGRPFFPKRAKRAGEPVPPPVGATPRARRVATRRAARPSVRSALRRSTRLYEVKGSALPLCSKSREVPPPMGKQYAILRVQKCKGAEIGAMQYHNDREPGKHANPDIDQSRTRMNREMCPHADYEGEVQARKSSFVMRWART